jgi:hypothetical protein
MWWGGADGRQLTTVSGGLVETFPFLLLRRFHSAVPLGISPGTRAGLIIGLNNPLN